MMTDLLVLAESTSVAVVPNPVAVVAAGPSQVVAAGVEPNPVVAVEIRRSVVPHKPDKSDDQQRSVSHNKDTHSFAA